MFPITTNQNGHVGNINNLALNQNSRTIWIYQRELPPPPHSDTRTNEVGGNIKHETCLNYFRK